MAKSKVKKPHPKPPENAPTVIELRKEIAARKEKLAKRKQDATKDGKLNKSDAKFRTALKRVKRAQRQLAAEASRLRPRKEVVAAAATPAAAAAAPAEGEKKE
jgi:hypothetical protein